MAHLPPYWSPPSSHGPHFASGRSDHCTATPGMSSPAPRPARRQAPPQLSLLGIPQLPLGLPHRVPQLHTHLQHHHQAPGPLRTRPPASKGWRSWAKQPGKEFRRRQGGKRRHSRCSAALACASVRLTSWGSSSAAMHSTTLSPVSTRTTEVMIHAPPGRAVTAC